MPGLRIERLPGYSPAIGQLVDMMAYARATLLHAVAGLTQPELDHLHDAASNSIGALLAHVAAVERAYQILTFEERDWTQEELAPRLPALDLGESGRQAVRGRPLESYLADLQEVRAGTHAALTQRDDAWLERSLVTDPEMNTHLAWFHVMEDEINHRGQIRWLRARLPRVVS